MTFYREAVEYYCEGKPCAQDKGNFFTRCVGTARFSYNWALEQWQDIYGMGGRPNETGLRRYLNHIKKEAYPWMYKVPKSIPQQAIPQQAIKNAGAAYLRFFQKLGKYPHNTRTSFKKLQQLNFRLPVEVGTEADDQIFEV